MRNKHPSIPSPNNNLAQPSLKIIKNNFLKWIYKQKV